MIWSAITNVIGGVAGTYMETRQIKATAKAKIETAKVEAEVKRIELSATTERDYDLEALRQTQYSYKDEVALVVVLAPFVGSFLPWTQDTVAEGWRHLSEHAPDWYTYAFLGAIGASMGIRWAVSQFGKK